MNFLSRWFSGRRNGGRERKNGDRSKEQDNARENARFPEVMPEFMRSISDINEHQIELKVKGGADEVKDSWYAAKAVYRVGDCNPTVDHYSAVVAVVRKFYRDRRVGAIIFELGMVSKQVDDADTVTAVANVICKIDDPDKTLEILKEISGEAARNKTHMTTVESKIDITNALMRINDMIKEFPELFRGFPKKAD